MTVLETERLILRRFKGEDWKDLYDYLSSEVAVKYEPYGAFDMEACKQEAVRRSLDDAFWAVCLKENNRVIGNVYFQQQEPSEFRTWELGYVFNPIYYGNGYATESCRRILNYGFTELAAYRVIAMCNPDNPASWKLLERLGMRREGHLIKNIYFKNDEQGRPIWNDTYVYAMLAEEWTGARYDMIEKALYEDLEEILALQKLAYLSEAEICGDYTIPPLVQTLEGIKDDFKNQIILKIEDGGRIIGSIRALERDGVCYIGRVIVHPERQNKGLGKILMKGIEEAFRDCGKFSLFTGKSSPRNMHFYSSQGYKSVREEKVHDSLTLVYFEKENNR